MDSELTELIAQTVDTRAKLDLLRYLSDNPYAWESLDGLAQRLYRAVEDLEPAVAGLTRDGVLEGRAADRVGHGAVYSYRRDGPHNGAIARLMAAYDGPDSREVVAAVNAADRERRARELARKQHLEDLKTRFVSMVSHELRTPVTAVRAILTTILKQDSLQVSDIRALLERAMGQCDRLTSLVENLLVLSGLQAGDQLDLYLSEVPVTGLVGEVVEGYRRAELRQEIVCQTAEAPAVVVADEYLLAQALRELLGNAVKFSPEGGRISLVVTQEGDRIRFAVTDEGVGIQPRQYERIFEEFYQVEEDASRRASGLGLGLFLARNIVERHGGEIGVMPGAGRGATVSFAVPLAGPQRR
jgi:signal transduction histidine kinase